MRAAGQAGIYSLHLPTSTGGGGLGRAEMLKVEEHVYRYGVGLNPAMLSWSEGATPRLIFARDDQREEYVEPLLRGEATSLHGVTEPNAGSNFFDFTTRAEQRGGRWVLNGHKAFSTNAFEADVAQVLCVTDSGQGRRSFSYFQFKPANFDGRGFRRGRLYQTMWDDGITGEFFLDDLELGDEHLLGERGQGFEIAMTSINWTRMRRGGMCAGWGPISWTGCSRASMRATSAAHRSARARASSGWSPTCTSTGTRRERCRCRVRGSSTTRVRGGGGSLRRTSAGSVW